MILDKADRKKTDKDLKIEIEELKKMRNKDVADIKMLKVELNKIPIPKKCNCRSESRSRIDSILIVEHSKNS